MQQRLLDTKTKHCLIRHVSPIKAWAKSIKNSTPLSSRSKQDRSL